MIPNEIAHKCGSITIPQHCHAIRYALYDFHLRKCNSYLLMSRDDPFDAALPNRITDHTKYWPGPKNINVINVLRPGPT